VEVRVPIDWRVAAGTGGRRVICKSQAGWDIAALRRWGNDE